jgi:N-acetylmuramoyl-L-alanine amidase
MRKITKHIVHCSDSPTGDVKAIRGWHKERGWDDVGYHFIIRRDGEIEVGRTLDVVGAHVAGHNTDSIGTCLIGRETFMPVQMDALRRIHGMLQRVFPGISVHGHREFNPGKTCPNFDVHAVLKGVA